MLFDVYVPKAGGDEGFTTLRVDAEDWPSALKTGLSQTGQEASGIESALCTVRDDGWLQINEASGNRVFFVRELQTQPAPTEDAQQQSQAVAASESRHESSQQSTAEELEQTRVGVRAMDQGQSAIGQVVAADHGGEAAAAVPEAVKEDEVPAPRFEGRLGEIETTILKLAGRDGTDVEGLASHVLDLALTEVPCEAGSVLFSHLNGQDLYFASARGPKSEKLVGLRIPSDKGIVGFCSGEGVCLGVTDVHKDARFFGRVSKSIGFDTQNILCAPVMAEGQIFGAIELINKEGGAFNKNDLSLLSFVGFQMATQLKRLFH